MLYEVITSIGIYNWTQITNLYKKTFYYVHLQEINGDRCMWQIVAKWSCTFFLAGVYFYGGIPKLFNIEAFSKVVAAYGIVPDNLVTVTAVVLPSVEVVTAVGLLLNKTWAKVAALLLLLLFMSSYNFV